MKNTITNRIKWNTLLIALGVFLFSASFEAKATHLMGGQITYTHVSGNTYQVTLTIYRDCDGVNLSSSSSLAITGLSSVSLPRIAVNDVTILCPGQTSTCNGGSVPGIEEHIYRGNITLSTPGFYTLSYSNCCRNSVITTGSADGNFYLSAEINTLLAPGNSSPDFLNKPIGKYCTGSPTSVGPNGSDPDGDVIVYSLVPARASALTSVNYIAPFSGANPLTSSTGVSINPNTGEISFTPTAVEIPVLAFIAEEYRVISGVSTKIGEVYREIQLELAVCAGNAPPVLSAVPNAIVQVGQPYCVNINATDGATQNITLTAVSSILPPATFNVTSSGLGFANSTFCFTPQASDQGNTYTVSVNAQDDVCDSIATSVRTWNITVPAVCNVSIAQSSTDETCAGNDGTATANLVGGTPSYSYSWTGPGGFTSFVGPTITGLVAGTYNVNISDGLGCAETATIVVGNNCAPGCAVNNTFSPISMNSSYAAAGANAPDTYYWGLSAGFIKANPTGGVGPYTYQWSSSAGYAFRGSSSTKQRARMWYPTGPQWVKVAITDIGAGCTVEDSVYIDWVDYTCNQPFIWYYELCNTVTGVSSCVQGTWNMRNLVNTGNYTFGPCNFPSKTEWSATTDESAELGVNIFPNPSNGEFTYMMSNATEGSYSISIMDMNGRALYSETIESKDKYTTNELDLSHLSSGMYIFKISNEQSTIAERLVIQ